MLVDDAVGHSVGTADILELKVADPYGIVAVERHTVGGISRRLRRVLDILKVAVHTVGHITEEVKQRTTYIGYGYDVIPLSVAHYLRVGGTGQSKKLVLVERNLELGIPFKVSDKRMTGDSDLDSAVTDMSVVTVRCLQFVAVIT